MPRVQQGASKVSPSACLWLCYYRMHMCNVSHRWWLWPCLQPVSDTLEPIDIKGYCSVSLASMVPVQGPIGSLHALLPSSPHFNSDSSVSLTATLYGYLLCLACSQSHSSQHLHVHCWLLCFLPLSSLSHSFSVMSKPTCAFLASFLSCPCQCVCSFWLQVPLSCSLSSMLRIILSMHNEDTVEPLYNRHHWDQRFCPL